MSRSKNMARKRKTAKRERQEKNWAKKYQQVAAQRRKAQQESGMPADVYALQQLLRLS